MPEPFRTGLKCARMTRRRAETNHCTPAAASCASKSCASKSSASKPIRGLHLALASLSLSLLAPAAAHAQHTGGITNEIRAAFDGFERHEIAGLALTLALLWFGVVAAVALVRNRARAERNEQLLRGQIQTLQAEADRSYALLLSEPQIVIAWQAGDNRPEILGDLSLLAATDSPQRVTAFGTWLAPEPALDLEHAVDRLRMSGESFSINLTTQSGRAIEATGRAIGGKAIVRLRELTGVRRELAEQVLRQRHAIDEAETMRGLIAALPWPVWIRRADGALSFANAAYAQATEAREPADAVARGLELLKSDDRDAITAALARGQTFHARLPAVIRGNRHIFDVHAAVVPAGAAAAAVDVSEAADLHAALKRMAEAHRRTLDELPTAVAIFDGSRQLAFYNQSYRRLWDLDAVFLDSNPSDAEILDRLRAARKLPEEQDFRQWKNRLHEAYHALEAREHTWHLPDGRTLRVVTTPNTEGGLTYLLDDVTERLDLVRRFDVLNNVQRETLDNLGEGVAVFASDGRLSLYNPAFMKTWRLATEALEQRPHIEAIQHMCLPLCDDVTIWDQLRAAVTGIENRVALSERIERKDGTVLNCTATPLPDGATLLTFEDLTDSFNVERALRERNDALETADQIKVNFVHHVSYELRSPLTTIIGFAHFLNDPGTGPLNTKQSEYIGYITASTNALLAIINDILDLAGLDAGALTLDLGPVDVRSAIEAAAGGVEDRLVRNHIALHLDIPADIGTFVADERRVVQVLYNLLANAASFSPRDGGILVSARRSEHAITFSVSDEGPGIPAAVRDRVFDPFESHTNGTGRRGAGLGLTLVRSFVELHGGRVVIEPPRGKGTTVSCEFPLAHGAQRNAAE
jgi:signal transduction histidine kinase